MSFTNLFNNKPHCEHIDNHGTRCKGTPQKGKKLCFMHDPEQKEKQAEARRKGGQARFQPYEPKLPPNFKYSPPEQQSEVNAFIDQVVLYFVQGEMDLRSARFLLYALSLRLAQWNTAERRQYRAVRSAEHQARILAREKDPWSPAYSVLARAAKANQEARNKDVKQATEDNQPSLYPVHETIAAALDHDHNRNQNQNEDKDKDEDGPWQPPLRNRSSVTGTRTIERNSVRREEKAPEAKPSHAADLQRPAALQKEDTNGSASPKRLPQPAEQQQNAEPTPLERLALYQRYKNRKY